MATAAWPTPVLRPNSPVELGRGREGTRAQARTARRPPASEKARQACFGRLGAIDRMVASGLAAGADAATTGRGLGESRRPERFLRTTALARGTASRSKAVSSK